MSRSKDIGTRGESAVVTAIRERGFPHAERSALKGSRDEGDITGTPGVCWEVKSGQQAEVASDALVLHWMAELDDECVNKAADVGVLVMKRKGIGHGNADRWWAVMWLHDLGYSLADDQGITFTTPDGIPVRMTLADACRVLRALGYGGAA